MTAKRTNDATAKRNGVLVIGSATIDVTSYSARRPRPGETVRGTASTLVPGGKGANQAIAAARSGARTIFAGCVGDDALGRIVADAIEQTGIDARCLDRVAAETGLAHIRVTEDGENDIVIVPNANSFFDEQRVDSALDYAEHSCSVLLMQLEVAERLALHASRRARGAGMLTILDPAPAAELPQELWSELDIVTPNETEATMLTGCDASTREGAIAAGRELVRLGAGAAIVTRAGEGVILVCDDDDVVEIPAPFSIDLVDTTAAGDAFAGYLAAALAEGHLLIEAIRQGMAAGALAVTTRGASASIPFRDLVDARLAEASAGQRIA